jgi:aspartyl-tRNA(Asn)/glutamyl-tRNA(Gln) amidotransferase subunit A
MSDLALFSVSELLAGFARKRFSPVEVAQACLARISRLDPVHNAFCLVDAESALAAARASEARWARGEPQGTLDGVPATIKDLLLTAGWPTLRGSKLVSRDQAWNEDAPAVARLRERNAILLGKTTTPEFGWKGIGDSPLTGITRNPWDPSKTAGGSSAGAAVAAAFGMGALHVGTDGGGSIRMPAGFCGIFGLKPTFGRVAAHPASPAGLLAHIGPMTRGVEDAARMMEAIARPDDRDVFSLPPDDGSWLLGIDKGVVGLKVGFSPRLGGASVDPEIAAAAEAMALGLREGVDPAALYEVITHSAGNSWMFENRMAHVLAADYTPLSAVDIFVKDLGLVLDMARASKFPLPLSSTAHQMFMQASTAGFAKEDDSAVIKIFPGIELPKAK